RAFGLSTASSATVLCEGAFCCNGRNALHQESPMAARGSAITRSGMVGLALAVAAPMSMARAQTGMIVGRVTDRGSGVPLEAVRVQIGPTTAAMTDTRGAYTIRNAAPGPQTVRTVRLGFRPETRAVTVVANDS